MPCRGVSCDTRGGGGARKWSPPHHGRHTYHPPFSINQSYLNPRTGAFRTRLLSQLNGIQLFVLSQQSARIMSSPGVGHEYSADVSWEKRDILLFAISIGCTSQDELHFLYVSMGSLIVRQS